MAYRVIKQGLACLMGLVCVGFILAYYKPPIKNELLLYLEQPSKHPPTCLIIGIRVARKELHYFDRDTTYQLLGEQWYQGQMPAGGPNDMVVEKSPAYFTNPRVPERVWRFNPAMKMIIIVREPVARTISDYTQVHHTKVERNKSVVGFNVAVFLPGSGSLNTEYKPVKNSLYGVHFSRWLKYFPLRQFLILDGDLFVRDPLTELRRVEKFLHLQPRIKQSQLVFDRGKGFFCFKRYKHKQPKCLGESKGRQHIHVGDRAKLRLAALLVPYNRLFFSQINMSFPAWQQ